MIDVDNPLSDHSGDSGLAGSLQDAFQYAPAIRVSYPELVTSVVRVDGITSTADVSDAVKHFSDVARARLRGGTEATLLEIQAWRGAFAKMGLKPTQYRCAAESLLRRFRKEDGLPAIHPLVDLCNAISLAFAVPIAIFDLDHVSGRLEVRPADGTERYLTFVGEVEHPEPGEIIFADADGNAHARRWCNRQSGRSAVRDGTHHALIVAEALHERAAFDVPRLTESLTASLSQAWPTSTVRSQQTI
jgi:DNA/RNA-binding domain of Phe-tRNA-synthetase-like protein